MTRNLRTNLIYMAVEAIKSFIGPNASREQAARVLPEWQWLVPLGGEEEGLAAEILWHFQPAEPPMVPGLDFKPVKAACFEAHQPNESAAFNGRPYRRWCNCGQFFADQDYNVATAALMAHLAEVDAVVPA